MSQERTARTLDAVAWANRRLERAGLHDVACVICDSSGTARLLNHEGRTLVTVTSEDPFAACGALLLELELGLAHLLNGS